MKTQIEDETNGMVKKKYTYYNKLFEAVKKQKKLFKRTNHFIKVTINKKENRRNKKKKGQGRKRNRRKKNDGLLILVVVFVKDRRDSWVANDFQRPLPLVRPITDRQRIKDREPKWTKEELSGRNKNKSLTNREGKKYVRV